MGTNRKKPQKLKLTAGRPPILQKPTSISRKATRTLINQIHTLEKRKRQAAHNGDKNAEARIAAEIAAIGGLKRYQQASLQGQRNDRGGDSSRILMDWLKPIESGLKNFGTADPGRRLHMLEVGALSITNACSQSGIFDIERIDLNSQGEGILQQDFMERPLPMSESEQFDIISLSLVLNFVPEPSDRGDMLLRTLSFLRQPTVCFKDRAKEGLKPYFPSLFLVLPSPCISNSRYLDKDKLNAIMVSLGYEMTKFKETTKLVYYLWTRIADEAPFSRSIASFTKKELRSGANRNNFAIVLKSANAPKAKTIT